MLYREIMAVCSQIHTKHINTVCGQNVELLNVKLAVHIVTTEFYCKFRAFQTVISITNNNTADRLNAFPCTIHRPPNAVRTLQSVQTTQQDTPFTVT